MIGHTIGGKYAVVRLLGEGGMGAVYEARHTGTGRRVAIKVITGELAPDPLAVTRFELEARAAGAIESEHIVQILDVGRDDASGAPFLAMEYLVGEDVQQLLRRLGPIPADLALRIGVQACLGLEKAHAQGIVHRDIKPANLFLAAREGDELVLKVLDFGIAKVTAGDAAVGHDGDYSPDTPVHKPLTRSGVVMGSPLYMSPEQARNRGRLDHRTDIWSLGIVLHQALTGRSPFDHVASVGDFIVAVCTVPVAPIHPIAPWVDRRVAEAVERALRIEPADRYASVTEMRAALETFLPEGSVIRASMCVSVREALGSAPTALVSDATQPATPFVVAPDPPKPSAPPVASPAPAPVPARSALPVPKTLPGLPLAAAPMAASPTPPTPPTSSAQRATAVAVLLLVGVTAGLGGVYVLVRPGAHKAPRAAPSVAAPPTASPGALAGRWWSEAGQEYNGVVTGDEVELRVRDATQFPGLGFSAGEAGFVLHAVEGEPSTFHVEARVRPAPPKGETYEHPRAAASCVVSWSKINGAPLKAELAIDRLVVQTVQITPGPGMFVRDPRDASRVTGCIRLTEARAAITEIVLGRTPVVATLHPPAPHDAGGGGKANGSACSNDAQCSSRRCAGFVCR